MPKKTFTLIQFKKSLLHIHNKIKKSNFNNIVNVQLILKIIYQYNNILYHYCNK
jgi:hypothetical protein